MKDWYIFKDTDTVKKGNMNRSKARERLEEAAPDWRKFNGVLEKHDPGYIPNHLQGADENREDSKGSRYIIEDDDEILGPVNASLFLGRPLLVTGVPGSGKSTLAHAIAYQLGLGDVLVWPVNTKSTLKEGLYSYDALGRLQEIQAQKEAGKTNESRDKSDIGRFITLGPLGTSLLPSLYPKVLLIDEIDKSDIDLPNDLLHIFEEGYFEIPELSRIAGNEPEIEVSPFNNSRVRIKVKEGRITCRTFPLIIMTSNNERAFPAPFLRRCIRLDLKKPDEKKLTSIVNTHFKDLKDDDKKKQEELIRHFLKCQDQQTLATDQLLNAMYLVLKGNLDINKEKDFINIVLKSLDNG